MVASAIASSRSAPPASSRLLEGLVLGHVAGLMIFTSWAFGGQAPWARQVIAAWGGVGVALFFAAWRMQATSDAPAKIPVARWLWPLLVYAVIVGASGFNPSFSPLASGSGEGALVQRPTIAWLPSSARPTQTWTELWQFVVLVLSAFNVVLVLRRRAALRALLLVLVANAVLLAVFGTVQKLSGADGLWFGRVPSPNVRFFATFIYHNHWGAFTLLNLATCVALGQHFVRRAQNGGRTRSPWLLLALATLLLAATIPLCASRSSTVLMLILLAGAGVHQLRRVIRRRRAPGTRAVWPIAGLVLASVLAAGAVYLLGREVIHQRAALTGVQLADFAREDTLNSRLALYRDTWRMAAEKPWFGWGLESYATVFRIFNTQRAAETWVWIPVYAEAHNDWLQSLAEVGFVGTGLLVLLALLPLAGVSWRRVESRVPRYLLAGVALVLLYATLEFPFANPAVLLTSAVLFYTAVAYARLTVRSEFAPTR